MKLLFFMMSFVIMGDAFAATARSARSSVINIGGGTAQPTANLPQAVNSISYSTGVSVTPEAPAIPEIPSTPDIAPEQPVDPELEEIKKYRNICLSNNIGISNSFVWASRNSDTTNYSAMVEDTTNPKNNTCYVRVSLSSAEPAIDISDIKSRYFEMGQNIVCGSWVDEKMLEKRISDAKKSKRVWATVGAAVGGAGVGVGAMELFGNKLIGGAVQGQKSMEGQELLRSQILALKKSNETEYNRIIKALEDLEQVCANDELWDEQKPSDCDPTNPFIGLRTLLK